jgi:kojibiose phosphorylase
VALGAERVQQTQIIKQADVVMLLATLGAWYAPAVCEANLRYYEPRCAHGSSLSPPIHALLAARIGDLPLAMQYLREAMAIDLADTMGNAAQGIHLATLGGIWQAIAFGFAGLEVNEEGVHLDPHLPPEWQELSLPLQWHLRHLEIRLRHTQRRATITLRHGPALTLWLGAERCHLNRHETRTWEWVETDHRWQEVSS